MTTEEWHGWGLRGGWMETENLHIGPIHGRKQIAMYLQFTDDENVTHVRVLAFFKHKRDAYAALCAIDLLTGARQ